MARRASAHRCRLKTARVMRGFSMLGTAALMLTACRGSRPPGVQASQATVPVVRWLQPDAPRAVAIGASEPEVIVAEAGAAGDRFTRVIEAKSSDCVLIMARGSERITDVDLYAFGEQGSVLAQDDRPDPSPTLLLCPPHPLHIYVTARIASGQGVVAVGVQRVPPERARAVRLALRATTESSPEPVPPSAVADVDLRLRAHHENLGGQWTPFAQSAVVADYRVPTLTGIAVDSSSCVDVLALAPADIAGLDLEIVDDAGRMVARSITDEQDKYLVVCSEVRKNFALQLRPRDGIGSVQLILSRGDLQAGRAIADSVDLGPGRSIAELQERVWGSAFAKLKDRPQLVADLTLAQGEQQRFEQPRHSGCVRLDVYAGVPSLGVQVRVFDEHGRLIDANKNAQYLPILNCASGSSSVVVEAHARGGPLRIERSSEGKFSAAAQQYPRAASRLFRRAWELRAIKRFSDFEQVEAESSPGGAAWHKKVLVHAGQCADAFFALDGEESGVQLEHADDEAGRWPGSELHPAVAQLRLCCGDDAGDCEHQLTLQSSAAATGLFALKPVHD